MTPEDAAKTLINGNVTDFKDWSDHVSHGKIFEALVVYVQTSGKTYFHAVNYFQQLLWKWGQ